jgi:zinc D-Ala-D-Ala carboxypeptidase
VTRLSTHFTLAEFIESDTAKRKDINNDLPLTLTANAKNTCEMMERIRAHLCSLAGKTVPIIITSGYRGPLLNRAIGSKDTSDHTLALAVDFKAPTFGSALSVSLALAPLVSVLGIGQLIYEFESWVHVSTRIPDKIINRIITINKRGVHAGILEA